MKTKKKIFISIFLIAFTLVFSGCGQTTSSYKVNLEVWSLYDDSSVFSEAISQYKKLNPHVGEIKYRKFTADTYKQELVEALASGQGPDIFLIHNTWVPSFANKIESAPVQITNEKEMRDNFVDVVANDFLGGGKVYGYPLSVDSLALYYNKSMFSSAAIVQPPTTWGEFNEDVRKLTKVDNNGNFIQSGVALGTADINSSKDILSLLMMQNGAEMINSTRTAATFNRAVTDSTGRNVSAGENALAYYTQFAKLGSPLYTWNSRMGNSLEDFASGKVAMMINYSWQIQNISSLNPKLNYGIAPLPQVDANKAVNQANYWAFSVSKNKTSASAATPAVPNNIRVHEAWQFLKFLTVNNKKTLHLVNASTGNAADFPIDYDPALEYLKKTKKPAARRDLINIQKDDPLLSSFALGNLVAKSWYQADPDATTQIFNQMIDSVNKGENQLSQVLQLGATRMNSLMQKK